MSEFSAIQTKRIVATAFDSKFKEIKILEANSIYLRVKYNDWIQVKRSFTSGIRVASVKALDGSSLDNRRNWNELFLQMATETNTSFLVLNETGFIGTSSRRMQRNLLQPRNRIKVTAPNDQNSFP